MARDESKQVGRGANWVVVREYLLRSPNWGGFLLDCIALARCRLGFEFQSDEDGRCRFLVHPNDVPLAETALYHFWGGFAEKVNQCDLPWTERVGEPGSDNDGSQCPPTDQQPARSPTRGAGGQSSDGRFGDGVI